MMFGMGFGIVGLLLMLLFWGGLIFGAVWLVRALFQVGAQSGPSGRTDRDNSPRDILDQRYARGEITRQQYEGMRQDLEA
jgi:putative membrane protein